MHRTGHLGISNILLSPLIGYLAYHGLFIEALTSWMVFSFLSTFPDIDIRLGFVKHRGITHTLIFAVIVGLLISIVFGLGNEAIRGSYYATFVGNYPKEVAGAYGFAIGSLSIVSHLVGDVITPMGIRPLVPFSSRRFRIPITKASSPTWNTVFGVIGILSLALATLTGSYFYLLQF